MFSKFYFSSAIVDSFLPFFLFLIFLISISIIDAHMNIRKRVFLH